MIATPPWNSATAGVAVTLRLSCQVLPFSVTSQATSCPSAPAKTCQAKGRIGWNTSVPVRPGRRRATPSSLSSPWPRRWETPVWA